MIDKNKENRLKLRIGGILLLNLLLLTALQFSCSSTRPLSSQESPSSNLDILRNAIDLALQDSALYRTITGIRIVSLDRDEVIYSRDSQLLFHPASNMKLLTTATALKKLGPDFHFPTLVLVDSVVAVDSIITGNLYLKGFGNPDLITEDLEKMVSQLQEKGIKRIDGDLVCDDSYFDDLFWGSGWMWDDASAWYWAPITPLTVNDNCVDLTVRPGKKIGDTVQVEMFPDTRYMKIVNTAVTVDSADTLLLKQFKVERQWKHPANRIEITGGVLKTASPKTYTIDVVDGTLYTGTVFSEILSEKGIKLDGKVVRDTVPKNARDLVRYNSQPLSLIIYNTNKISDNLSAELILKTIGAEKRSVPGTAEKGISVINEYLSGLGVDTAEVKLADGSGVSRYNLITPELLIELLKDMDTDFGVQAEFKSSLPIAAVDGTLENRMTESPAAEKLRAKTGTLSGVSALSGYTTTQDGEKMAFSIIMEHFVGSSAAIRRIQDRIGELISGFSRSSLEGRPLQ